MFAAQEVFCTFLHVANAPDNPATTHQSFRNYLLQVPRGFGALLLAPLVDKMLTSLQSAMYLKSKRRAFLAAVLLCLGVAGAVMGTIVVLHA